MASLGEDSDGEPPPLTDSEGSSSEVECEITPEMIALIPYLAARFAQINLLPDLPPSLFPSASEPTFSDFSDSDVEDNPTMIIPGR